MPARVALVTGGAKRIGQAIVLRLHADGFDVCLHCRGSRGEADELAATLNARRADSARVHVMDLADTRGGANGSLAQRCRELVDACYASFGRCDVLVNNASAYMPTPLLDEEAMSAESGDGGSGTPRLEEQAADLFGSNALAPFYLTRAFARRGVEARRRAGLAAKENPLSIVNLVDSMAGQPLHAFTAYTMAKHALEGLTKSAAVELAAENIRVNAVGPGLAVMPPTMSEEEQAVYRAKVPLGQREGTVEEIAAAVSFLVSPDATYITGSTINVDGGWSLTRA